MERADMTSSQTLDDEELQWDDDEGKQFAYNTSLGHR